MLRVCLLLMHAFTLLYICVIVLRLCHFRNFWLTPLIRHLTITDDLNLPHSQVHVGKGYLFFAYIIDLIFVCLISECENLFLRHKNSGKCITTAKLVYKIPDYAKSYFAVMTDNCLNSSAQFRYVDNELSDNFIPHSQMHVHKASLFSPISLI